MCQIGLILGPSNEKCLVGGGRVNEKFMKNFCRKLEAKIRGGADKSLARPGRKEATTNKLGIYSTSPHEAQYIS